jgi:hypothetical protein
MKVLQSPSYLGKSGDSTLFSIQTSSGKQIRSHSYFQHEDEILLPPGTYLRVIGQLNPAPGFHIIQLEEVTPPFELLAPPFPIVSQPAPKPTPPPVPKPTPPPVPKPTPGQLFIFWFNGQELNGLDHI